MGNHSKEFREMSIVTKIRVVALMAVAMMVSYASVAEAGFGDRLRGRGGSDCCEPVCCEPVSCCDDPCDRGGLFSRFRNKHRGNDCCPPVCCEPAPCAAPCAPAPCAPAPCCEPAPCCDPCDPCCKKEGFFSKLRGKFKNRGGNCCDPCAPACGC